MRNKYCPPPFVILSLQSGLLHSYQPSGVRSTLHGTLMNIRDLRIDPASLGTKKLLVDVAPAYEYKDGKRTDTVTGYRYIVALPAHSLEKIGVRIDGKQLMEKPEGFIEVEFADLEVTAYESQGHVQLTAKATGISTVRKN